MYIGHGIRAIPSEMGVRENSGVRRRESVVEGEREGREGARFFFSGAAYDGALPPEDYPDYMLVGLF